ncbi:MAG: hypothetical protein OXE85_07730 [Roseovarius sp.]|nr:hypothetical protein [Roseovarius sp.]
MSESQNGMQNMHQLYPPIAEFYGLQRHLMIRNGNFWPHHGPGTLNDADVPHLTEQSIAVHSVVMVNSTCDPIADFGDAIGNSGGNSRKLN